MKTIRASELTTMLRMRLPALMFFMCSAALANTPEFIQGECSADYLQGCNTCEQLARVTSLNEPDNGDYYRAAQWNGLYAAYVHNCMKVAEDLLRRGADPNWGGIAESMVMSISDKWPHDDIRVNRAWADLLLKHGATATKKLPDQEKTPEAMVKDGDFAPDYPEIFKKFLR